MDKIDRDSLYDALLSLQRRARSARNATGKPYSQRESATQVRAHFHSDLGPAGQRISDWLQKDPDARKVPQSFEALWALVQLWSDWAGEEPRQREWADLFEAAHWDRAVDGKSESKFRPVGRLITELDNTHDPLVLEVHRAIDAPGASHTTFALPRYVERAHDRQLSAIIDRAAGGVSGMAVLVGESSTGKTRACWEAIQRLGEAPGKWRVWHPVDPLRTEAFLEELPLIASHTVVWLNEAQHYLLTPSMDLGERIAGRLRGLLRDSAKAPVLVLGTIWPEYAEILTEPPSPRQGDSHSAARSLLDGVLVRVPDSFRGNDMAALRAVAATDPRLKYALERAEDGEITQYLAGGPALLEKYQSAPAAARAVIEAAMDARRLGHSPALPVSLMQAAALGYLPRRKRDQLSDHWLEDALAYVTAPTKGAVGALTQIRASFEPPTHGVDLYRLADYLEGYSRQARRASGVSAEFWQACQDYAATVADRINLGKAASARGLLRTAFSLYATGANAGHQEAAALAAAMLRKAGRIDEALGWYERSAEAGNLGAVAAAARMLSEAGRVEEALDWYERAAIAGDPVAAVEAAWVLEALGRVEEAVPLLERRASAGDPFAAATAARVLRCLGRGR